MSNGNLLKSVKILSEPTRLRMLVLLGEEEVTVAELQEVMGMGQSRISTHLGQLKGGGLVKSRRVGKNIYYSVAESLPDLILGLVEEGKSVMPEVRRDMVALGLAVRKRRDQATDYFNKLAGKFGRTYIPGRSWRGLAHALLRLLPPMVVVDLGAGEGTLSQLLAKRAERVIAVDRSEEMVAYGRRLAEENGVSNIEFRLGDVEAVPVEEGEADLVLFSQVLHHTPSPARAVREAFRIVKPGGQVMVLDLAAHTYEQAKELYAHAWLGFSEVDLHEILRKAGFVEIEVSVVAAESQAPHFRTILATGRKEKIQ